MKLLVGLGNPGIKYENTRHNVGFMVLTKLLADSRGEWGNEAKANALVSRLKIAQEDVVAALPQAYMNLSGEVIRELLRWYKLKSSDLIVVHDELDIEFGKIKVKKGGGDAGHNGVKSIINYLGDEFIRVRVGIGRPEGTTSVESYVLENFSEDESGELEKIITEAARKANLLLKYGYDEFVSKYNS